jgi:hypothetical protein
MKTSFLSVSCVFVLLTACGSTETTVPDDGGTDEGVTDVESDGAADDVVDTEDSVGDSAADDGQSDGTADVAVDGTGTDAACVDGDERTEDCNRCECLDGAWACTEIACADAGDDGGSDISTDSGDDSGDDAVDDASDLDSTDVDSDVADVDGCYMACGLGCPAPEFQPCGTDGERYCNECIMECDGIGLADTTFECEAPCALPAAGTEPVWSEWTPPEGCPLAFGEPFGDAFFLDVSDEESFVSSRICPEGVASGIDWEAQRLVRAVVSDNPAGSVLGVRVEADVATIYLAAPAYCGGARPPSMSFYLLLPAGDDTVEQDVCIRGQCQGPPRP